MNYKTTLDKKKIIFIGNSYTYYGQTVLEKSQKHLTQESRRGDKGYFYQLCRRSGMEVEVTNWTFGGHGLAHMFSGCCSAKRGCDGVDHKAYITDPVYDFVVIQAGSGQMSDDNFLDDLDGIMKFFRSGNPETKFVYLVPYSTYGTIGNKILLQTNILNQLKTLDAGGITVVDWGGLVMDILQGKPHTRSLKHKYEKYSFVVRKSEKDGFHPNQLSGYITTLMTFCAITGASAVGQPCDFCGDPGNRPAGGSGYFYSFDDFVRVFYRYENQYTVYPEVFASADEMLELQRLIDRHLAEKTYLNYEF